MLGLLRDVERLLRGRLHGGGQLVAGDAGFELGFARMQLQVPLVELVEKRQVLLLERPFEAWRRIEIEDPRFLRPQHGSLIKGRHEAARPVERAVDRMSARIGQHHVRRQVLRFVSQGVDEPASHRRPAGDAGDAAVEITDRHFVAVVPGVHRADDGDVIDDAGNFGEQLRDLGAALAALFELERTAEEFFAGPVDEAEDDVAAVIGAAVLRQLGLGIEQVDVRRAAVHEERDHRVRFGGEVRGAGPQVERQVFARLADFGRSTRPQIVLSTGGPGRKPPIPNADWERNSRRDELQGSVDMQELVGAEKLLTETGQGRQLVVGFVADRPADGRFASRQTGRPASHSSAVIGR